MAAESVAGLCALAALVGVVVGYGLALYRRVPAPPTVRAAPPAGPIPEAELQAERGRVRDRLRAQLGAQFSTLPAQAQDSAVNRIMAEGQRMFGGRR